MIIKSESYFRKPPTILLPRQVVIFDAIRYSIDICDIAFERLKNNLYDFSFSNLRGESVCPMIFADIWMIIDSATVFSNVVSRHFNIEFSDPLFDKIRDVKLFRHSNQHIDERILEVILDKQLPIYGSLSWYAKQDPLSEEGFLLFIHSGTVTHKEKVNNSITSPSAGQNQEKLNNIQFTGIVKKNRSFEAKGISVNELIKGLAEIVDHLELQLIEQLKPHEPMERHRADLFMHMKVKLTHNDS